MLGNAFNFGSGEGGLRMPFSVSGDEDDDEGDDDVLAVVGGGWGGSGGGFEFTFFSSEC